MRLLITALLVLVAFAGADVVSGTLYHSAAQDVDNLMESLGIWDGRVKIIRTNDVVVYAVEFPGEYFSINSDSDVDRMAAVFAAVGVVSANTSWRSDSDEMFENMTWRCHICGKERPDDKISVHTRTKEIRGVTVSTNVRYCNDNPDCREKAKSFDFFGKEEEK